MSCLLGVVQAFGLRAFLPVEPTRLQRYAFLLKRNTFPAKNVALCGCKHSMRQVHRWRRGRLPLLSEVDSYVAAQKNWGQTAVWQPAPQEMGFMQLRI